MGFWVARTMRQALIRALRVGSLKQAGRTAVAAVLTQIVVTLLGLTQGYWAVITTVIVMLARDIPPDRLTAAKTLTRAVLARLPQLRVGLVTFAGQARLACPVTADRAGLLAFLDAASPQAMPLGGTDLAGALEAGRLALLGGEPGAMLLLSDGEATLESPDATQVGHGPTVYTVAVGGALPTTLPGPDGTVQRDAAGQPVAVGVNVTALADLAQRHGGQSFRLAPDAPAPDAAIAAALRARLPTAPDQNGPQRPADRTA